MTGTASLLLRKLSNRVTGGERAMLEIVMKGRNGEQDILLGDCGKLEKCLRWFRVGHQEVIRFAKCVINRPIVSRTIYRRGNEERRKSAA